MLRYRVTQVTPLSNFRLKLTFEDGKQGIYDMQPLLQSGIFRRIANPKDFSRVRIEGISVEWPFGVDIAPEELYEHCTPLHEAA